MIDRDPEGFGDGASPGGDEDPMSVRHHVRGFPTVVVIDAKGNLRDQSMIMGDELDKPLEGLVAEAEAARP